MVWESKDWKKPKKNSLSAFKDNVVSINSPLMVIIEELTKDHSS